MVKVEYVVEQGVYAPVWFFIAMAGLLVLGVTLVFVGKYVARSSNVMFVGMYACLFAVVIPMFAAMLTSYTSFTDEEAARVADEIGRVACLDVTETDVILMFENEDQVIPFEYDKMDRDGKSYFVMEGKC